MCHSEKGIVSISTNRILYYLYLSQLTLPYNYDYTYDYTYYTLHNFHAGWGRFKCFVFNRLDSIT